jgi:hypothetical protein
MAGRAIGISPSIESFLNKLGLFQQDMVFNPWANNCPRSDGVDSYRVRIENLRSVLYACATSQDVDLWIGRDLGWRGGRRTGVPLVDELSLISYGRSIDVLSLAKATIDAPMKERTATEIELARSRISRKLFFWNVFPFHPHKKYASLTNRTHTRDERAVGAMFMSMILELIQFQRVIAIGNDAAAALREMGVECLSVRHPSYGGQKDFHRQIGVHYGIGYAARPQLELFQNSGPAVPTPAPVGSSV